MKTKIKESLNDKGYCIFKLNEISKSTTFNGNKIIKNFGTMVEYLIL